MAVGFFHTELRKVFIIHSGKAIIRVVRDGCIVYIMRPARLQSKKD